MMATPTPVLERIHHPIGFSRPVSPLTILAATVVKQLQIASRYLPNLFGGIVELAIRAVFFLILANTISVRGPELDGMGMNGKTLYIFLLGSLVLFVFTRATLWGPINAVTNDLYNGTLEYLYSNPGSRYAYYVGNVLAEVILNLVVFIPLFVLLILYSGVNLASVAWILSASMLVLVALTAMGVMIALLALIWRQVGALASILGILFEMLAGAYLPISAFPQAVQYAAYVLPYTWAYDLIRFYSFQGQWKTIIPVPWEWLIIVIFAIIFTLMSSFFLYRAELAAKRSGLHII